MSERRIYLVRHAIAEDRAGSGRDADRALTREGRRKMKRAARGLAAQGVRPSLILMSPLVRARETAEIVTEALAGVDLELCEALAPGVDEASITELLERRSPSGSVMLVGHEPDMGELLAFWLCGRVGAFQTRFRKGAVACLLAGMLPPHGRATLEWLLTADQLGSLG